LFYEDQFFLTEKTYKPIFFGQPFIIVGPVGTLRHLRKQGYRTFYDIWDESYDDLPNTYEKLKVIARVLKGLNLERLQAAEPKLREICEHNRLLITSRDHRGELIRKLAAHLPVS
jgi:hypothetical protein